MQQEPAPAELLPAELLTTVGHEFRGPLTTIQGYATTLLHHEQHLTSQERLEFFRAIHEASLHLCKRVDQFLELAALETHVSLFRPEEVYLPTLIREAMAASQIERRPHLLLTSPLRENEGCQPEDQPGPAEKALMWGDRRLLRMMLDILLENAIIYSDPESLIEVSLRPMNGAAAQQLFQTPGHAGFHQEIIVSASFQDQEPVLLLRVRDYGIGMEPAHLARIFQRFYRVETSLTRETNGLGLGLTFCQAIVTAHQGMLQVESAVGEGSTFSIVLPCQRFAEADKKEPQCSADEGSEPPITSRPLAASL